MVAGDEEARRAEAREQRETELLAGDLGLSPDGLLEAARGSGGRAFSGLFPGEAATAAEPRGVQAAMREQEDLRLREEADGDDELAEVLLDDAADRREREDLGSLLGMSEGEIEVMLEQAPRPASDLAALDDLRLAESIGIRPGELANMLES
jgi:hypothetical protein